MFKGFTAPSIQKRFSPAPLTFKASGAGQGRPIALVSNCSAVDGKDHPLAAQLRADGWQVTILDTAKPGLPDKPFGGCGYHRLAGTYKETNWYLQIQSLTVYHWLRARTFDAVVFHNSVGTAFYSCMGRKLGLAFQHTPIVMVADETHASKLEQDLRLPSGRNDFEADFMERRAIELADGAVCGSPAILDFMRETGWIFPAQTGSVAKKGTPFGQWLDKRIKTAAAAKSSRARKIFISVCMATYNRATYLREALQSLEKQTSAQFEVIVVDDGSTDAAVGKLRQELAPLFRTKGWRWIRQKNAGPAAARNHAAKLARGDYLLFLDDDDMAYPDEIERFALAAQKGGDIIACILGMHPETENGFPPTAHLPEREGNATRPVGWTPIGGNLALAVLINVAGYAHALYKRTTFKKLGGFTSDKDAVFEDFELLIRALIAGCRIDVVPEVLMLYRRTRQSRSMGQDIFKGHLHSLKAIAELLPPHLRALLLPLRNEWYHRHCQRRDGEI